MEKKIIVLLFALVILSGLVIAQQETLGTFKQNTCVSLIQTCGNCTYSNLTSVVYPNGNENALNRVMTAIGTKYNHTFCNSSQIGKYVAVGVSDVDGIPTVWAYDYYITPSGSEGGFTGTFGFYLILIGVIIALVLLGFAIKDGWFVVFGGIGLISLGVYSINSGIAGFRDMFMTWSIALFEIGVGSYLAINASLEMINENM